MSNKTKTIETKTLEALDEASFAAMPPGPPDSRDERIKELEDQVAQQQKTITTLQTTFTQVDRYLATQDDARALLNMRIQEIQKVGK